jgi:hypothetical protein
MHLNHYSIVNPTSIYDCNFNDAQFVNNFLYLMFVATIDDDEQTQLKKHSVTKARIKCFISMSIFLSSGMCEPYPYEWQRPFWWKTFGSISHSAPKIYKQIAKTKLELSICQRTNFLATFEINRRVRLILLFFFLKFIFFLFFLYFFKFSKIRGILY